MFALESMAAAAMVDLVGVWHALGCCSGWSTIDELKPVLTGLGWFAQTFLRVAQKSGYRAVQIGEGAELRVVFVPCDDPDFNTLELKSGVYIVAATEAEIQAMDSALHMLPTSVGPENQLGGPPIVAGSPNVVRDKPTEDRDRFVYGQCCEGVAYGIIAAEVKKNTDWEAIESKQGIKAAAKRFAARHELPEPPARQSGRPRTKK